MKYYDGMGKDVSDYVAGLEQTVAELKAKLELHLAPIISNVAEQVFTGSVETTEVKPKPRRRTEPDANTE
jgi:hypothetical protein